MAEEISISFLLNNSVAVGVMWYVLTRLKPSLDKLANSIDNLNTNVKERLNSLEDGQRQFQMQIHELKLNVDAIKRGDS